MIAWNDVIEIELTFGETFAAILAGVFIAKENIFAAKFHFFAWKPIVDCEDDNLRNLQRDFHGVNHFFRDARLGILQPRSDVVSLITRLTLSLHHLSPA